MCRFTITADRRRGHLVTFDRDEISRLLFDPTDATSQRMQEFTGCREASRFIG